MFLLGACAACAAAQDTEFIPLGDLPGGSDYSVATAVTTDGGTVVGVSSSYQSFWGEAVLWDDNGIRPLGFIQDQSTAIAISPFGGWVAGGTNTSDGWQAFAWSESTGMFAIGDLPGGGILSEAYGVSNGGRVIVGNSKSGASGPNRREAFRWTPDEGMLGLGFLGGEVDRRQSSALAVSDEGNTIVGYSTTDHTTLAFRWAEDTGMIGLEDLPGGLVGGSATDVSADGRWIVGGSDGVNYDGTNRTEAVLWHPDGTIEGLGILDRGEDIRGNSGAYSISDDGRIIIGISVTTYGSEPFIWTRLDGMRPIEEFLLTDFGIDVDAMGWNLIGATISGDGSTLVGTGTSTAGRSHSEAWMVTNIPAPATLTPLAALGLFAARRRRG